MKNKYWWWAKYNFQTSNYPKKIEDNDQDQIIICYKNISDLLCKLDDKDTIDEQKFRSLDITIQSSADRIQMCFNNIWWTENDIKKFEAMYDYYLVSRYDYMDYVMKNIEKELDLKKASRQLEELFNHLSVIILKLEFKKKQKDIFNNLDNLLEKIKTKLNSSEVHCQMTVLEFNRWANKYNQALAYVKKAYVKKSNF